MRDIDEFHKSNRAKLGFFLHPKLGVHILIILLINLITITAVLGLFELLEYPILTFLIPGIVFFIIISTLLEVGIKIFILRYFIVIIFKSFGTILLLTQALTFYFTSLLIKDLQFNDNVVLKIVIFTIGFYVFRTLLIIIYQRYIMKKSSIGEDEL